MLSFDPFLYHIKFFPPILTANPSHLEAAYMQFCCIGWGPFGSGKALFYIIQGGFLCRGHINGFACCDPRVILNSEETQLITGQLILPLLSKRHRLRNKIHVMARNWDLRGDKNRNIFLKRWLLALKMSALSRQFGASEIN